MSEDRARGIDRENAPNVVYVPPFIPSNYYDQRHDAIVLDERLKEWPAVHDIILEHETKHAEYGYGPVGALRNTILELRTDLFYYFSSSEEAKRVREYHRNSPQGDRSPVEAAGSIISRIARLTWGLVIYPLGSLYHWVWERPDSLSDRIRGFIE